MNFTNENYKLTKKCSAVYVDRKMFGNTCYLINSLNKKGYVTIKLHGTNQVLHRILYNNFVDTLKKGEHIIRTCGDIRCHNVHHLQKKVIENKIENYVPTDSLNEKKKAVSFDVNFN